MLLVVSFFTSPLQRLLQQCFVRVDVNLPGVGLRECSPSVTDIVRATNKCCRMSLSRSHGADEGERSETVSLVFENPKRVSARWTRSISSAI